MYFSSSTFHYTWHSALQFALGKEPFSHRCWWTLVTMYQSGISHQWYFCWCLPKAALVLHCKTCTQNSINFNSIYFIFHESITRHIIVILHGKLACSQLLFTMHLSGHCTVSYLTYYWHCYGYMSIVACIPYTSATTKPITIVNCINVCNISDSDLHLELDYTVQNLSPGIFCILIHVLTVF
jgi:hypothetical protein